MKLKTLFLATLAVWSVNPLIAAENNSVEAIINRGYISCGTDLGSKVLAYKDSEGFWQGIDADICRNFAAALLGNDEAFRLVDVSPERAGKAFAGNQIDIMLGNSALSARQEMTSPAMAIDLLYFDRQVFATREKVDASSMEEFRGQKVCVVDKSAEMAKIIEYNYKFALEFKILPFADMNAAKQAFLLNRCELISGSEIYLKGLSQNLITKTGTINVLPENIAYRPVYAYSRKDNPALRIAAKWIINAPKLAEEHGLSSKNIDTFIGVRDVSLQNLLGGNGLWNSLGIQPNWVSAAIKARGNFGEMLERNLGQDSPLQIERDKNKLIEQGGLVSVQPFI